MDIKSSRWSYLFTGLGMAIASVLAGCSGEAPVTGEGAPPPAKDVDSLEELLQVPVGPTQNNEPSIAINPLNPYNIAVAFSFAVSVSTDYGNTFSAPVTLPGPPGQGSGGDIAIAFDSQGRLFAAHISVACNTPPPTPPPCFNSIIVNQINPTTGAVLSTVNASAAAGLAASGHDRLWFTADRYPTSLFRDRLYAAWTNRTSGQEILIYSSNSGTNWTLANASGAPAGVLSLATEGQVWQNHAAVAANGDVYVAYQSELTFTPGPGGQPDGLSGGIILLRSTNGGANFNQRTLAYARGSADVPYNEQHIAGPRILPNNTNLTIGSITPFVLPDPRNSANVLITAADDINNADTSAAPDVNVYLARSINSGVGFTAPVRIDAAPAGRQALFPTGAFDDRMQCMALMWYDNRAQVPVQGGTDYQLDVYTRGSTDNGVTFGSETIVTDSRFDPDLNAPQWCPNNVCPTPKTWRIGEYNGIAVQNGIAHVIWTGNDTVPSPSQRITYDTQRVCNDPKQPPTNGNLTAVKQSNAITEVFAVGADGALYRRQESNDGPWQSAVAMTSTGFAPAGAPVATGLQQANQLDVFVVGNDGRVYYFKETNDGAWTGPTAVTGASAAPVGARLATGFQFPTNQLDVFWVDSTGALKGSFVVGAGTTWTGPLTLASNFAPSGAALATGYQGAFSEQLDVFAIGSDGSLRSAWEINSGLWNGPLPISGASVAPAGAWVATGVQSGSQLDAIFVGNDGRVKGAWVIGQGLWNAPINLNASVLAPAGAGVTTSRNASTNRLDVFFVSTTGAVDRLSVIAQGTWTGPTVITKDGILTAGVPLSATPQGTGNQRDVFGIASYGLSVTWTSNDTWPALIPLF